MVLFYFVLRVKQEVYYRWFDRLKREKRCLQITQQRNDDRFIQAVVQKLICILHNKRYSLNNLSILWYTFLDDEVLSISLFWWYFGVCGKWLLGIEVPMLGSLYSRLMLVFKGNVTYTILFLLLHHPTFFSPKYTFPLPLPHFVTILLHPPSEIPAVAATNAIFLFSLLIPRMKLVSKIWFTFSHCYNTWSHRYFYSKFVTFWCSINHCCYTWKSSFFSLSLLLFGAL